MIRRLVKILSCLIVAAGWAWTGSAATFSLNDGQTISGDVSSGTAQGLILRKGEGEFALRIGERRGMWLDCDLRVWNRRLGGVHDAAAQRGLGWGLRKGQQEGKRGEDHVNCDSVFSRADGVPYNREIVSHMG